MDLDSISVDLRDKRVAKSIMCTNIPEVRYFSGLAVLFQIWNITNFVHCIAAPVILNTGKFLKFSIVEC